MVEFLIVYLPVLVSFLMFWQLGELLVAQMIVERASSAAARAAVVLLPDDPAFYNGEPNGSYGGQRKREIRLAAGMMLAASPHLSENFTVDIDNVPTGDVAQIMDVRVDAEFRCKTLTWVCGTDAVTVLSATAAATYHGANYEYEPFDVSNLQGSSSTDTAQPGCSDEDGNGAGGKNNGNGSGGSGNGNGNGNGNGSGGKGSGGAPPDCPPGQTPLKDGTCATSKGGKDKCKDGTPAAPDGLCNDGTCPSTGKKPSPADTSALQSTDAEIRSTCQQLQSAPEPKKASFKSKIKSLFSKRKKQDDAVCNAPPAPECPAADACPAPPQQGQPDPQNDWKKRQCEDCHTVYSGRCYLPNEAFKQGLMSKAALSGGPLDLDLQNHVTGSTTTGYLSASFSSEAAAKFAMNCGNGRQYVFAARVCGGVKIDYDKLAEQARCNPGKKGSYGPDYFESPEVREEMELSVVRGIDGEDIISATEVSAWGGEGEDPLAQGFKTTKNKSFQKSDAARIKECKASLGKGQVPF